MFLVSRVAAEMALNPATKIMHASQPTASNKADETRGPMAAPVA